MKTGNRIMPNNLPTANSGSQNSPNVSLRAVLLSLFITIPNSYWLMINWGSQWLWHRSEFSHRHDCLFQCHFCSPHFNGSKPIPPNDSEKCQFHRCRIDGDLSTGIHRFLHCWTRYAPNLVATARIPDLVRKSRE